MTEFSKQKLWKEIEKILGEDAPVAQATLIIIIMSDDKENTYE